MKDGAAEESLKAELVKIERCAYLMRRAQCSIGAQGKTSKPSKRECQLAVDKEGAIKSAAA